MTESPSTPTNPSSPITFIIAVNNEQRKIFKKKGKGEIVAGPVKPSLYWYSARRNVSSLNGVFSTIKKFLAKKNSSYFAVMRGQWLPDDALLKLEGERKDKIPATEDKSSIHPRLLNAIIYKEKIGGNDEEGAFRRLRRNTLMAELPLHWVAFDLDGPELEGVEFDVDDPFPAVNGVIASELGDEFVGRDYILQLSSSAGIKPGVRAHCWFWLKTPFTEAIGSSGSKVARNNLAVRQQSTKACSKLSVSTISHHPLLLPMSRTL